MRKLAKKQQSHVQTIQITATSRNVTQDNGNGNNFLKGSRWFCHQCLRTFCYFIRPESRKMALWKTTFVSEHLNIDQPNWPSVLHSLHALPVAVLAIPANSAARANHAKSAKHSRLLLSCVLSNTHTLTLTQTRRCFQKSLCSKK